MLSQANQTIRIVLLVIVQFSCSFAAAIPNVFQQAEDAKASAPVVVSFRVTEVRYEQKGDVVYTFAEADVLSVERGSLIAGDAVSIFYGSNFVLAQDQWKTYEKESQSGQIGGVPPKIPPSILYEGQVATGWFSRREDDGALIPAADSDSFETHEYPEILAGELKQPLTIDRGQVVRFADVKLELRLARFEWVSTCPRGVTCVKAGENMPVVDIFHDGRYQSILLRRSVPSEIMEAGMIIEALNYHTMSTVTVVLSRM
jgi:hypothetical protein